MQMFKLDGLIQYYEGWCKKWTVVYVVQNWRKDRFAFAIPVKILWHLDFYNQKLVYKKFKQLKKQELEYTTNS